MGKSKFTAQQKYELLRQFTASGMSGDAFRRRHNVSRASLNQWRKLYDQEGLAGLEVSHSTKHYSLEIKLGALGEYLNGEGTLRSIADKYGILSDSSLRKWLIDYHRGKPLAEFVLGGKDSTMARLTGNNRLEVVKYVEAGHTYTEAAAKFNVSYQQARLWTVKFNKDGIEALKDNRGHNKATQSGSEVDELKQEIRVLKKKLYDQETIIMFQKKLKELQQRE